jgi:hypothetical protein
MPHTLASLGSSLATFASLLLLAGCGATNNAAKEPHFAPPSEVTGDSARCDGLCDLHATGQTLDALCNDVATKSKDAFTATPTCTAQRPIGIWVADSGAVHDAAFVEVTGQQEGSEVHYAILALSTDRGWEVAREVARLPASSALKVKAARAAEVDGLAKFGVEIRIQVDGDDHVIDRTFVCGVAGNEVTCPIAVQSS